MPNVSFEVMLSRVLVLAVLLLVAFPIHEFAHALAAYRLGDSTARLFGRLTLNPLAHFDPAGGLMLTISVLLVGFGFGWAKPTPVNPRNLEGGRWGEAIVAAAGPISNLILAIVAAIPLRFVYATNMDIGFVELVLQLFIVINLALMLFNLLPIPPLDGSAVLFAFLPPQTAWTVRPLLAQYGVLILILLIFPIFGGRSLLSTAYDIILFPLYGLLVGV
ncbi:MAG TPA: site-2 protease family protein [Candidatus Limnocylindrales bacterium]|nr:site-2 protease family protein [Candidatus Limnocylindrales bacterium]